MYITVQKKKKFSKELVYFALSATWMRNKMSNHMQDTRCLPWTYDYMVHGPHSVGFVCLVCFGLHGGAMHLTNLEKQMLNNAHSKNEHD